MVDAGALVAVDGLNMKYSAMTESNRPKRMERKSNFFIEGA
jgi:hypothetical protein